MHASDRAQLGIASKVFLEAGPRNLAFPAPPEPTATAPGNSPPVVTFLPAESGPTNYTADTSKTRRAETNRRYLDQRRKALMLDIAEMEFHLGVQVPWEPNDPDYVNTKAYIATRDYQVALLNLQRLVVQRLFELHKMNLAQTGTRKLCYMFCVPNALSQGTACAAILLKVCKLALAQSARR